MVFQRPITIFLGLGMCFNNNTFFLNPRAPLQPSSMVEADELWSLCTLVYTTPMSTSTLGP